MTKNHLQPDRAPARTAISLCISEAAAPFTVDELACAAGCTFASVFHYLRVLRAAGLVKRAGKRHKEYLYTRTAKWHALPPQATARERAWHEFKSTLPLTRPHAA